MNNIKNTWKGIKSILTIKNTLSDFRKCLSSNGSTFTNQVEISKTFNNYFASIAEKTKVSISYSPKHFYDFLKDKNQNSFFQSTGVFPTMFKVAKVIPVHKKDSELDLSNYRPI